MTTQELLAFSYGIKLALRAHGHGTSDEDAIMPVFKQMQGIISSPRNSLISAHDDVSAENHKEMRELEHELCQAYLAQAAENAENAESA